MKFTMRKSKVSPDDPIVSTDSETDSEGGLLRFLHLSHRKLDKDILAWVPEPERHFVEQRYTDLSYSLHLETSFHNDNGEGLSNSNTKDIDGLQNPIPINFLLRGTIIHKNASNTVTIRPLNISPTSNLSTISNTSPMKQNNKTLSAFVKRVPATTDLHANTNSTRNTLGPQKKRGCSVS